MFGIAQELWRRPRLCDPLHAMHLVRAQTQLTAAELACLVRHARGRGAALEIGTFMGASACAIAAELAPNGHLHCVDPWKAAPDRTDPCLRIARRELRRRRLSEKVTLVLAPSAEAESRLPGKFDFIFVDGDHSYRGIGIDWGIVVRRLAAGGVVCLHDTTTPDEEPWRRLESVAFYHEVIAADGRFEHVECRHSMNVLHRVI